MGYINFLHDDNEHNDYDNDHDLAITIPRHFLWNRQAKNKSYGEVVGNLRKLTI